MTTARIKVGDFPALPALTSGGMRSQTAATLGLAFPIIVGQILQNCLVVIDTFMVARVSVEAVAAGSFAMALFNVPLICGFGVLGAISVFVARAAAHGDASETAHVLRHGLILSLGLAGVVVIFLEILCNHLGVFHQPPAVVSQARNFLLLLTWSIVPMYLFQTLKQYCEALQKAWVPMLILTIGVVVNTVLNWIFIYGHLGCPALGLYGAGCSTLISRTGMLIVLAFLMRGMFFRTAVMRKSLFNRRINLGNLRELVGLGFPAGVQVILEVGAFSMAAVMMGWISERAMAAYQVAISVTGSAFMVPLGLSMAVAIRVSHAVTSGSVRRARQAARGSLLATAIFMAAAGILIFSFSTDIARLFVHDRQVITLASRVLMVVALAQIFDGVQIVTIGALRGLHDVRVPTLISLCGYWMVALPVAYLLAFRLDWGAVGIWWGLLTGVAFVMFLLVWRLEWSLQHAQRQHQGVARG